MNLDQLPPGWRAKLAHLKAAPFYHQLDQFLNAEYASKTIFPERKNVLRALNELDLADIKVVILGQDPYHGPGQAIGFSFAVPNDLKKKPPSLQNIFKELKSDLRIEIDSKHSDLSGWVEQGVLLLNTVMTVEAAQPLSHRNQGWEEFTDEVIRVLNERDLPMVFILWGGHAQKFKAKIDLNQHVVLESAHPSPLSAYRGFFGSKIFSRTNEELKRLKLQPIDWGRT